jgi:hypothetical protein
MANRASGERVVPVPLESLRAAVPDALNELGWEWTPTPRGFNAIWTSGVFRFKDDVEIGLEPRTASETRVLVQSRSRVGHYDFGQNARHVRELFRQIEASLKVTNRLKS